MPEPSLTDFLQARIAEDEAKADAILFPPPGQWAKEWWADELRTYASRVLAECETKRHIIERQQHAANAQNQGVINPASIATLIAWTDALRLLVAKDADHPDYQESWRP